MFTTKTSKKANLKRHGLKFHKMTIKKEQNSKDLVSFVYQGEMKVFTSIDSAFRFINQEVTKHI